MKTEIDRYMDYTINRVEKDAILSRVQLQLTVIPMVVKYGKREVNESFKRVLEQRSIETQLTVEILLDGKEITV